MGFYAPNFGPFLKVRGVGSLLEATNMHNTNKAPLNMHGADNLGSFQKDGGIYIPLKTANSYFMENPTFDMHVPSEMHKSNVIPIEDSYYIILLSLQ